MPVRRRRRSLDPAVFRYAPGFAIGGETFTRPSPTATQFDVNGVLQTMATNAKRDAHYINGVRTTLLEATATNIAVAPRDMTNAAWVKTTMTAAKDQVGLDNAANSASSLLATGANATVLQAVVLASSLRAQSTYVKRLVGAGVINMTTDGGTTWTVIAVGAGWTRVKIPAQTVANPSFGFRIVTSGDKIAVDYVQNETGANVTSPVIGARGADLGSIVWNYPPVATTFYVKYIENADPATATQRRILRLGTSDVLAGVQLHSPSTNQFQLRMHNGVSAVVSTAAAAFAVGDTIEVRGVILPNGQVYVGVSINGAAEILSVTSGALVLPAAWTTQIMEFPTASSSLETMGVISLKILPGEQTMVQLRAA